MGEYSDIHPLMPLIEEGTHLNELDIHIDCNSDGKRDEWLDSKCKYVIENELYIINNLYTTTFNIRSSIFKELWLCILNIPTTNRSLYIPYDSIDGMSHSDIDDIDINILSHNRSIKSITIQG